MTAAIEIKLPAVGMDETAYTLLAPYIVFVSIWHDPDTGNPLEDCDGMGKIFSLSRRHSNRIDIEEARRLLQEEHAVPLSYYEHGNCLWFVQGSRHVPDEQWDCAKFAGVWVPDAALLEEVKPHKPGTPEYITKMEQWAREACAEYTEWCNGNTHGYGVRVYQARYEGADLYERLGDYRKSKVLWEDSCGGCIGDYIEEAAKEAAEDARKAVERLIGGLPL